MRERLPELFPGTTFAFLPADIVTQILNFGLPAPIDVQVIGSNLEANRAYADKLLRRIALVNGVADARIQQAFDAPTLNVAVDRVQASQVGITERDVATSLQDTLAGSIQTAPTFWLNPKNGVSYPIVVQSPQYWADSLSSLENTPASAGTSEGSSEFLAVWRRSLAVPALRSSHIMPFSQSSIFLRRIMNAIWAPCPPISRKYCVTPPKTRRLAPPSFFAARPPR